MPNDLPAILTSNSAYGTWHACNRRRYWGYEAISDPATATRGWERQRLSLPLSTGSWCHRVAQGLLAVASGGDLSDLWAEVMDETHEESGGVPAGLVEAFTEPSAAGWITTCIIGYRIEAHSRGLDLGLSMDGQLPEERFVERTIAEQSALLEAFGWAYLRIRIANIISEYRLLDVGKTCLSLSEDVGWNPEHDALLERKSDGKRFGYRVEISGNPDRRWRQSREIDHTLLVDGVDGVLIDGFDIGERVKLDPETLRESREHPQPWEGQRNCLVYGYKHESYGRTEYSSKNITQKGWGKFAVWEEDFPPAQGRVAGLSSTGPLPYVEMQIPPVAYWVNWLPIEQVEEMFTSFTVLRNDKAMQRVARQIISMEEKIRCNRDFMEMNPADRVERLVETSACLDEYFPQNLRACIYDKCQFFTMCHGDATSDPQKHGFIARRK